MRTGSTFGSLGILAVTLALLLAGPLASLGQAYSPDPFYSDTLTFVDTDLVTEIGAYGAKPGDPVTINVLVKNESQSTWDINAVGLVYELRRNGSVIRPLGASIWRINGGASLAPGTSGLAQFSFTAPAMTDTYTLTIDLKDLSTEIYFSSIAGNTTASANLFVTADGNLPPPDTTECTGTNKAGKDNSGRHWGWCK